MTGPGGTAPPPGPAPGPAGEAWYVLRSSGKVYGPFPQEEIVRMVLSGRIDGSEQVSRDQASWASVAQVEPFATALAGVNPAAAMAAQTPPATGQPQIPSVMPDLPAPTASGGLPDLRSALNTSAVPDLPARAGTTPAASGGTAAFGAGAFAPPGGPPDLPAPAGTTPAALPDLPAPAGAAGAAVGALPDLPAPARGPGALPELPAPAAAPGSVGVLPDLPAPAGAVASGLPDLPAPAGTVGGMGGLPDLPAPAGQGLPDLPAPAGGMPNLPAPAGGVSDLPAPSGGVPDLPAPRGMAGASDLPAPAGQVADPFAPPSSVFAHGNQDLPAPAASQPADPFEAPFAPAGAAEPAAQPQPDDPGSPEAMPSFNPNVGQVSGEPAAGAAPPAEGPPGSVADWASQSTGEGGASVADWLEEAAGDGPVEGEPVSAPDSPVISTSKDRKKKGGAKKIIIAVVALGLVGGGAFMFLGEEDRPPKRTGGRKGSKKADKTGKGATSKAPKAKAGAAADDGGAGGKVAPAAAAAAAAAAGADAADDGGAGGADAATEEGGEAADVSAIPKGDKDPAEIPVDSYRGYQWAAKELFRAFQAGEEEDLNRSRASLALAYRELRYPAGGEFTKKASGLYKRIDDPEDYEEGRLVPVVIAMAGGSLLEADKQLQDVLDEKGNGAETKFVQGELLRLMAAVDPDKGKELLGKASKQLTAANKGRKGFQRARYSLALVFRDQGKLDPAKDELRKVLAKEPSHPAAALELATILLDKREYDAALKVLIAPTDKKVENAPSKMRSKAHHLKSRVLLRQNRGEKAEEEMSVALKFDPGNVDAMRDRAEHYRRKGQCKQMLKAYRDLQTIGGDDASTGIGIIKALVCLGRRKDAVKHVEKGGKAFAGDARFPYYQGLLHLERARLQEAREALEKAQLTDPKFQPAVVALADLLAKQGKWAASQASIETALVENPDSAVLHDGLGRILFGREKYRQAEAEYRKAIDLDPDLIEARFHLATVLRETKRYKEALAEFKAVQNSGVDSVELHFELGRTLQLLGQLDSAIEEYRVVLTQDERTPEYPYQAGTAYYAKGDYDKARNYFQLALQIETKMAKAMFYIGLTYLKQNAYDEAVKRFQNASDLDRKNVRFQYWLAHTFRLQGKKVQAKELLLGIVKAIERNPLLEAEARDVWIELGLLYKSSGEMGKALTYFKRGLGKHEKRPMPWFQTAEVVARLAQYEKAIPLYERALKLDKDFGEAWYKLAQAYIQQKKPDYRKTTDACAKAIDNEAGTCWCMEQMALIYDERKKCKKALRAYRKYLKACGDDLDEDEFREVDTAKIKLQRKCG